MPGTPINTVILTGFLGSGKTTVLNHLLEREKGKQNFVVENEFGKVSVDGNLVQKNYNELFEMNNGCVCCSLDGELVEVLAQLIQREDKPDNLFIEASGVADAGQLASIFKRDDVMKFYRLRQVICLVDAENFEDRLEEVPEIPRQVVAADILLINKADLVQDSYLASVQNTLRQMNPFAKILTCEFGKFELEVVNETRDREFLELLPDDSRQVTSGHRMKSIAIEVPHEFERSQLYVTLSMSIFLYYEQIYRIKGFVRLKGEENPVLVQSTGNKLTLTSMPTQQKSPPMVLVFIGRNIERKGIERILGKMMPADKIST